MQKHVKIILYNFLYFQYSLTRTEPIGNYNFLTNQSIDEVLMCIYYVGHMAKRMF